VLVGAWNTVCGYLIFVALDALFSRLTASRSAAYMAAMVLANPLAIANAFYFHKYVTFGSTVRGWAVVGELARFAATYAFTFALSLVLLPLLVEWGGLSPRLAGALITLICTAVSYLGHSRFSFRQKGG